jgi:hypothetical protein
MPPNVIGSAIADKITKETRYSKAFGDLSAVYEVRLRDASPADLRSVNVSGKIEEDDMARSIGQRVAVKCYRDNPGDFCYASSYEYGGREFVPAR